MRRKIYLLLTIILSLFIFSNKAEAIVMWMQCTENPEDMMECGGDCKHYGHYNTFAVVNDKGGYVRNLAYNPNDFYGDKKPVFIMAEASKKGLNVGSACWWEEAFDDMEECDKERDDEIPIESMLEGICPVGVRKNDASQLGIEFIIGRGWGWGNTEKDFLVLYGTQPAFAMETLDQNIFVIYGFQDSGDSVVDYIIEGYSAADGRYGYATTWEDWASFEDKLDLPINKDKDDLIDEDEYHESIMTWEAMTQARRVEKLGKDYFKLLDTEDAWLINAKDTSVFVKKETDSSGNSTLYYSDDRNGNFKNWTQDWYQDYSDELNEMIELLNEVETYTNLLDAAYKIKDANDAGKKYEFSDEYTAAMMAEELSIVYPKIEDLFDDVKFYFAAVDENCNLTKSTDDPLTAAQPEFLCNVFGVNDLEKLNHKYNSGLLGSMIATTLSEKIRELSRADYGIEDISVRKKEYLNVLTIAVSYLNKYNSLYNLGMSDEEIKELKNKYVDLAGSEGLQIVVDCEGLLGQDLIDKINSYLNIIKIAIPIILIGFGVIDFTKALFAGNEDNMKKAQKDFLKRLGIAVLIFFIPTLVNFILGLANQVWNFIEPSSCGLFE